MYNAYNTRKYYTWFNKMCRKAGNDADYLTSSDDFIKFITKRTAQHDKKLATYYAKLRYYSGAISYLNYF